MRRRRVSRCSPATPKDGSRWSRWSPNPEARSDAVKLEQYLARRQQQIDRFLERCIPSAQTDKLTEAMRYSLFSGGKRIRPILALAASDAVGGEVRRRLPFACAIELIHTYS